MSKQELYKAWRPETLEEMTGNATTVKSIQTAIKNDSVPHLILISGPSGCGKTTIGRILKKELDCSDHDYVEINCAVNGGVDFARDVTKKMNSHPMQGKCKIYFMDECHKLTSAAINAYLKPFEDTPEHVYFIMATSEFECLGKTKPGKAVITRSTHWRVESLDEDEIIDLINEVAAAEMKDGLPEKISLKIAEASTGSARLALVLLQQMIGLTPEEMQEQIEISIEKEASLYDLFSQLMWKRKWPAVQTVLKLLKEEPESIRRGLLTMAGNQMLGGNTDNWNQGNKIIDCLKDPLFNTGRAGLIAGCFETIFRKDD